MNPRMISAVYFMLLNAPLKAWKWAIYTLAALSVLFGYQQLGLLFAIFLAAYLFVSFKLIAWLWKVMIKWARKRR